MEKVVTRVKIEESECIGCTHCLDVCPVDAILGAQGQMHTVLTEYCIGCDLCLPACPVDCISTFSVSISAEERHEEALIAKKRIQSRLSRLKQINELKVQGDKRATSHIQTVLATAKAHAKQKPFLAWREKDE